MSTMASELIVDFHTQRDRSIWRMRSVQFADTSEMYIVVRHHDNQDVDRRDLWYNRTDYSRMRSAIQKSVRIVRAMASAGVPISYSGDHGSSDDCLIGIEHLLTQASAFEVKECRARCVQAVLQEQARQRTNPSATFRWDAIAAASYVETRKAAVRARKLGKLHRDSI
jgi:hypothetical protein